MLAFRQLQSRIDYWVARHGGAGSWAALAAAFVSIAVFGALALIPMFVVTCAIAAFVDDGDIVVSLFFLSLLICPIAFFRWRNRGLRRIYVQVRASDLAHHSMSAALVANLDLNTLNRSIGLQRHGKGFSLFKQAYLYSDVISGWIVIDREAFSWKPNYLAERLGAGALHIPWAHLTSFAIFSQNNHRPHTTTIELLGSHDQKLSFTLTRFQGFRLAHILRAFKTPIPETQASPVSDTGPVRLTGYNSTGYAVGSIDDSNPEREVWANVTGNKARDLEVLAQRKDLSDRQRAVLQYGLQTSPRRAIEGVQGGWLWVSGVALLFTAMGLIIDPSAHPVAIVIAALVCVITGRIAFRDWKK